MYDALFWLYLMNSILLIHTYFIKKGHAEFRKPISLFILASMGIVLIVQILLTIFLMQA